MALMHHSNQAGEEQPPHDFRPDRQLWLLRWLICGILAVSFFASIVAVILTQNPLFAGIPTAILLTMRPIIHWLFPTKSPSRPVS